MGWIKWPFQFKGHTSLNINIQNNTTIPETPHIALKHYSIQLMYSFMSDCVAMSSIAWGYLKYFEDGLLNSGVMLEHLTQNYDSCFGDMLHKVNV